MTRTRTSAVFAALLLLFLVATLPLAAALGWSRLAEHGFSARAVDGPVWGGIVTAAAFGGVSLGDISARISPFALLAGETSVSFASVATDAPTPHGNIALSAGRVAMRDVDVRVPLAALLPAAGPESQLLAQNFNVSFAAGRCISASGAVTADAVLPALQPLLGSLAFAGRPACEGERLLLPLTGRTSAGDASLYIRIAANGAYEFDFTLTSADPALLAGLAATGFNVSGGGGRLSGSGTL